MRIPHEQYQTYIYPTDVLILKGRNGKERKLTPDKWWINKHTPPGDDAELWERKPYGGKKYVPWREVIALEREPK
jgi:hypothetical protein